MEKKEMISFVIPCYNSTKTIPIVVKEITETMQGKMKQYEYEVILVNDCSPDGTTFSVIEKLSATDKRIKGISLARNFGQPSAVMAGMSHAKGDYVVCGDDDGQTPFCELPRFFEKIAEGYDVVEARYAQREKRSLFRSIGSNLNNRMAGWLISKPKDIMLTSFWVIRRYVADEVLRYKNSYPYIGGLLLRATRNVCNVDVIGRERMQGKSGYSIKKLIELWLNGFTSFSIKPLRMLTLLGIIVAIFGFGLGLYTIVQKIMNPAIFEGYSSIMSVMLFMFGVLFIILGMLGEYIGRMNIAMNSAPMFVIRETVNLQNTDE